MKIGFGSAEGWAWVERLRQSRGYEFAIRIVGGAWFLLLAMLVVRSSPGDGLGANGSMRVWFDILSQCGLVSFYVTLWLLMLFRRPAVAQARGIVPGIVALAGTYMPWLIVMLPRQELPPSIYFVAMVLILGGNFLTLSVIWCLGRSFSFVPQARRLVTAGPYAAVRHPLYLAEAVMFSGTALLYLSPAAMAILALHMTVQIRRMLYEEEVLHQAFADYAAYARRTRRVLPGVW